MTSAITPNAAEPANATSQSAAVPAQLHKALYSSATKAQSAAPTTSTIPSKSAVPGASAPANHGKLNTHSPVNGKSQMSASASTAAGQAGNNGNGNTPNGVSQAQNEHGKKPSVVISASGTSGYMPNGGPVAQAARPNISFGSINSSSASAATPTSGAPQTSQQASLSTPRQDPRITSPAHSPSPIPQPAASGGKPPAGLQSQSNGLSFGSMVADNSDPAQRGQMTPSQQPAHLRRESSQSAHSDMSGAAMPNMNRNFVPPQGRGRGNYMPQYGAAHSPAQNYRQLPNQQRGPPNMQNQYQGQQQMSNSPYRGRNSPALMHAQPHMPQGMQNSQQMHYGGYPQHLNPQQNAMYGMQGQYDPYGGFYPPYYPHGQYPQGAPPSPRPGSQYPAPYGGPPQHMPSPFHPPSMSRSASQLSERPSSSLGAHPPPSSTSNVSQSAQTPTPSATPVSTSSNFQIPAKTKSKAIVIKNAAGEEISFDKKPTPAPPAPTQSPAVVSSSAPTPPPRTPSTQQARSDTKPATTKSDAETKNAFQEQVKRQLEAQRAQEKQQKDEADGKVSKDKADAEQAAADQVKADQAKDDQVKADKAKIEQEKADQAKAEQDKLDQEKADQEKADQEKADQAKADQAKADQAKADQAKADQVKADQAKADQDKADADAKAAQDKETADTAAKEAESKRVADEAEAAATAAAAKEAEKGVENPDFAEDEAARLKREEDERIEAEIAEMEAAEKAEEERERAYQEKKDAANAEKKKKEAAALANADEEMKRLEREAEERELAKEKERDQPSEESAEAKADREAFAALKKPTVGPGATESAEEPAEDDVAATEDEAAPRAGAAKSKPTPLKLQTDKPVEPAQPTAGMQALKTARLLDLQGETVAYPEGIQSPNPAQTGMRGGRQYDSAFLLQFQDIFKEKPSIDWDSKVKETLGDGGSSSAHPGASRTPASAMGGRQASNRGGAASSFGPMGQFTGTRTLPAGTSSADRFAASQAGGSRPTMSNPLAGYAGRPGGFPMGGPQGMGSRTNSLQAPASSPRGGASRGGKGSRRGPSDRNMSRKEEEMAAKAMPLTANMDLKALEKSQTGWTARSIGQPGGAASAVGPDGHMPPDMVQRKVKAALNKMTPEKFDKISDQIMEIANQSKSETDGRTLRQVIQLTFEKACDEAHWAGMYAKFCHKMLTSMSHEIGDETIRDKNGAPVIGGGLFRKYLLNRCQEEFERGWEANLPEKPEGDSQEAALLSDEYYVAAAAKRRGLGLIQFIGELYKLNMLTWRIMHQCVLRLLNFEGQPDESAIENLTKLLKTVGYTMDNGEQSQGMVNAYFERITHIMDQYKDMPSRSRFMLLDITDLRKAGWKSKDSQKGPKTIQEIHAEAEAAAAAAEAEKARSHQRGGQGGGGGRMPMGRGDARNFSGQGGMPPPDYPRNQVGMDDLRRLQNRGSANRQASQGLGPNLGPSSLFSSRSGSGRKGLGPPRDGDASGATSRTNTPPIKKEEKDINTNANAFSALAALEGNEPEVHSPPASEKASPSVAKATPSIDASATADSTEDSGAPSS